MDYQLHVPPVDHELVGLQAKRLVVPNGARSLVHLHQVARQVVVSPVYADENLDALWQLHVRSGGDDSAQQHAANGVMLAQVQRDLRGGVRPADRGLLGPELALLCGRVLAVGEPGEGVRVVLCMLVVGLGMQNVRLPEGDVLLRGRRQGGDE